MILNELSLHPLPNSEYEANSRMEKFSNTVAEARKMGFRNIRSYQDTRMIYISKNYSINHWIHNKNVPRNYRDILFGMIIQPFIDESDELVEEKYISANYYFEDSENGIEKQECIGLASAYLYETLSISISSSDIWNKHILPIIIETETESKIGDVLNVFSPESLQINEINELIENAGEINLIETNVKANDKKIHLANHHGKSELQSFCNRIKFNPYVLEMRSTNWGGKNFIRETFSNGVIEIVLVNSQREYALWVQTTGSNLRETKVIADVLKEKYS